jgi:hypothetical protein
MSPVVEMNKDYRCVSDGGPERILGSEEVEEMPDQRNRLARVK